MMQVDTPVVENFEKEVPTDRAENTPNECVSEKETSSSKEDGSANNSYENMEPLIVNEDEDDDPLGTESLRMSVSEDEEKVSPVRRKKRAQQIVDSDEEGEGEANKVEVQESKVEEKEEEVVSAKPKKFSALIDSDSEVDEGPDVVSKKPSRISALIDSDSEEKETDNEENNKKSRKSVKKSTKSGKSKSKFKKSKPVSGDSQSDAEEQSEAQDSQPQKTKSTTKVSDIIDSDSDSSRDSEGEHEQSHHQEGEEKEEGGTKSAKKPQRASAKKAMDEMQAIQSETQRLYRETRVSIPYHKPKRHTLKEFLTRKTIAKPQIGVIGSGKSLKMSAEELEEYAKHLEERAKEATQFFKSESEDELLDNVQDGEKEKVEDSENAPRNDAESSLQGTTEIAKLSEDTQAMEIDEIDKLIEFELPSLPTTQELLNIEMPQVIETQTERTQEPTPSLSVVIENDELISEAVPSTFKPATPLSELKRRLIAEKNLPSTPTLKGDPNMIIDFETGDLVRPKPTGVEALFQRFVKSNANNKKKPKDPIGSVENDRLELSQLDLIEEPNKEKEPKPGAAYVKLKENLRSLIARKRKEDFKRKIEQNQEEEEEYMKCCGLDDDEEEQKDERADRPKKVEKDIVIDDEENEIDYENDEEDEHLEREDDLELDEDEETAEGEAEVEIDEGEEDAGDNEEEAEVPEAETDNDEDEKESDSDSDDDDDDDDDVDDDHEEKTEEKSTKKHRIIRPFEDSDEEKDEMDTSLNITNTSVLFPEEEKKNPKEVEEELLGLCSGQFDETQRPPVISQIPITQTQRVVDDAELMDLCSGAFSEEPTKDDQKISDVASKTVTKILSSDEEKEPEEEQSSSQTRVKKLKKKKKKRAKLGFSDDEDDDDESELEVQDSFEEGEENEEEIPQTFVDYDSEENEIEVQMTKEDCLKQATTFLEKEAELSESEWGSADEDEKNMDKYDVELGDEDEFDREKIQAELGQIHMRKVLDDDIREVKKIQNLLFDNEELDGKGRQRQFRWKNTESGFSLDNPAGGGDENDENNDSADDDEEMRWRKMRFEREQLLKQKTEEEILAEISATTLGRNLLATMELKKDSTFTYKKTVLVPKEYKAPSFLMQQNDTSKMRNSFLQYDDEALARIAEFVSKSGDLNDDEQLQNKVSKTGNFVFATLTEEEQAMRKRKAEEKANPKIGNVAKKKKPNTVKSLLLDKLL